MSNVIQLPVIAGVEIITDEEGRFNLKALHQAAIESGVTKDIRPNEWMSLQSTQEMAEVLITENPTFNPITSKPGRYGGTFVHELLAVSYAGWISPTFQLKVNQVFLDYRSGNLKPAVPQSLPEALRLAADKAEENEKLLLENQKQSDKIEKLENFFAAGMTLTAFAKMLNGVNCMKISEFCAEELGWLYNESRSGNNKRWRVKSKARDRYLTETDRPIGVHGGEAFIKFEPKMLEEGAKYLYDLYLNSQLPMKKTWNGEFIHVKFAGIAV